MTLNLDGAIETAAEALKAVTVLANDELFAERPVIRLDDSSEYWDLGGVYSDDEKALARLVIESALPILRRQLAEENKQWNEAVDWLLNSNHCGDPDIQAAFWLLADGHITRDEAKAGFRDDQSLTDLQHEIEAAEAAAAPVRGETTGGGG